MVCALGHHPADLTVLCESGPQIQCFPCSKALAGKCCQHFPSAHVPWAAEQMPRVGQKFQAAVDNALCFASPFCNLIFSMLRLIFGSLKLVVIFKLIFPVVESDVGMTSKRWALTAREALQPQHRRPGLCGTGSSRLAQPLGGGHSPGGSQPWGVGTAPGAEPCPQPSPSRREGARAEPCQHQLVISSDRIGMRNRI